MIKYRLKCAHGHEFEAWFRSSACYEAQAESRNICCPDCGDDVIEKAIMAPSVAGGARDHEVPSTQKTQQFFDLLREVRSSLLAAAEDVGRRFPEEARKIHHGETEARHICGTASGEEARALLDEGIEVVVIPPLPEDAN